MALVERKTKAEQNKANGDKTAFPARNSSSVGQKEQLEPS